MEIRQLHLIFYRAIPIICLGALTSACVGQTRQPLQTDQIEPTKFKIEEVCNARFAGDISDEEVGLTIRTHGDYALDFPGTSNLSLATVEGLSSGCVLQMLTDPKPKFSRAVILVSGLETGPSSYNSLVERVASRLTDDCIRETQRSEEICRSTSYDRLRSEGLVLGYYEFDGTDFARSQILFFEQTATY